MSNILRNLSTFLALVLLAACTSAVSSSGYEGGPGDGATPGEAGAYAGQVGTFSCPEVYPEETIGDLNLTGHVEQSGTRYATADATKTCHGGGRTPNPNYRPGGHTQGAEGQESQPHELVQPPNPRTENQQGNTGNTSPSAALVPNGSNQTRETQNGVALTIEGCKAVIDNLGKAGGSDVLALVNSCKDVILNGASTS